ncbi:MAG: UbiX family flavin prenyltransferase [Methanophagales archaeon ANME-1-THS]|nr:MAG: UbiX family flavin prenyltransferase [Methanophagales archaeon ANME-1-THS]
MRLVVGITGASGAIYAKRLLDILREQKVEVDVIITAPGKYTIQHELGLKSEELEKLATTSWDVSDMAADVASGSQLRDGMVILPCTMDMVAKMAHGISDNLLLRCFNVMLKENRKIVIVPRETPLHEIHLENLLRLRRLGVTILPPVTTFYHKPTAILDLVDFIIAKILDQFNIPHTLIERWKKPEGIAYE